MLKYLMEHRQGRFLVIGTVALILGFLSLYTLGQPMWSRWIFYIAMFFLGFYATREAVVQTIQDKSPNVDLLMILAALGAALINYESEGAMLLFIFAAAEVLEAYANSKTTSEITALMEQVPETAQKIMPNGETETVSTEDLELGDLVLVARGEQIPIDGTIDRVGLINEAALTGESAPVDKVSGSDVFAGTLNEGDSFQLTVTKTQDETVFSNIIRMVEEAQGRPSQVARFIDTFEPKYVIAVLITVPVFIAILYFALNYSFSDAFYRGMVLLTVASPCALVASVTPATLSAISNGAKHGILVKGGAAMESLASMDVLFSDKTGTLTKGLFEVVEYDLDDSYLAEVVYMEQASTHPIAEAIIRKFTDISLDEVDRSIEVREIAGEGLAKGDIKVGKITAFEDMEDFDIYKEKVQEYHTTVMVSDGNRVVGFIDLSDQIRPQAKAAVQGFLSEGVDVVLLTGDNNYVAKEVADEVGIEHYHSALLPEDKIKFIQEEQKAGHIVGMIGDGINDAPALAQADIGVGMGSGSSAAMESSDVVIVKNDLTRLLYSFRLSQRLNTIIKQNIFFAIGVMILLIVLNIFGVLDLPAGVVFHEGSTILVIINGLRLLRSREDLLESDPDV